ncbi:MAG: hypothetical protein P1P71_02050 [Anaerosomatales bacterium]|nr:hypothetical protein [Anaerosomatales bacterium]
MRASGRHMRRDTRVLAAALLAAAALLFAAAPAVANVPAGVMTPADVIEIDRALDGSVIVTQGEAIGERLRAHGGGSWVNILYDGSAFGIWVPDELSEVVEVFGGYQMTGDTIRVTGVVNVACDTHGGEFDVHAASLDVIQPGGPRDNPVRPWKGAVGAAGLLVALILWQAHRQRRERRML